VGGPPSSQGSLQVRKKSENEDETFGALESTAVRGTLRALPKLWGIALGALGEFSESANLLIEALPMRAHSRAPVNLARATTRKPTGRYTSGSSNYRRPSRDMSPSSTPEVPLSSRRRRLMLRPKPRMTGGAMSITAGVKRKLPLPSFGGLVGA
jgi:hypothetical protein